MISLPVFFSEDGVAIAAEIKADMENRLGKVIGDADVEQLDVDSRAYRELLKNIQANDVMKQNFVRTATGIALDYLGELVGVSRLSASSASCIIRFTLNTGHIGVTIPAGTRVQSIDGKVIFSIITQTTVAAGTYTKDVAAICKTTGTIGNGYAAGNIGVLLDPIGYVDLVANTETTSGGADDETDDALRERIVLAPSSFSVAGPIGAYKYWAKTANPAIVDVEIDSLTPGEVQIYPLLNGGVIPNNAVLDEVLSVCNDEKVRPLSDTVYAIAPTKIDYAIEVDITFYDTADIPTTTDLIQNALDAYKAEGLNKLGRDVIREQISSLCVIKGLVYDVTVVSPASNIVADKNEYTNCTGITINNNGINGG